ncbi:major facilitator superfamily domain-containing protein [Fennellomyces sp. T-0311]|nr:major facilitator superfamily domain-containing protein [Fennellomyces sp. T-0311]
MILFVCGINDGNLGIILPSIKAHYNLSEYVVSIIFLCNTAGYMLAAILNGYMIRYFSQSKTALIGACFMAIGFLIVIFAVPFAVYCASMVIIGFGVALTQAAANVVCGEMPHRVVMLSILHSFYAAASMLGPLMASGFLSSQKSWNMTYTVLCGLAGANTISIFICFRSLRTNSEKELDAEDEQRVGTEENQGGNDLLVQAFKYRITTVGPIFLIFYTGAGVTLGNWSYTYWINERSTDTVGMAHIMSGYWAGVCAGRLFLGFVTTRFGEKRTVYCYLAFTVIMMVLFWALPYVGANAMSLVVSGIMLGPIFPTVIAVANQIVPTRLYATCVGFLSALASAGTAIFPYLTGVLIGSRGVSAMLPFCVATSVVMLITWIFVPDPRPRAKFTTKISSWMVPLRFLRRKD